MKKYANYNEDFKNKKRRKFITKTVGRFFVLAVLVGGLVYGLFFAHLFEVRTIEIHTQGAVPVDQISSKVWELLNERHLGFSAKSNSIIFSPQRLREPLLGAFSRIDSLDIRRVSLHGIDITVHERIPVGLWCFPAERRCLYYDSNGIAFAEVLPSSGYLFVPISDYRPRTVVIGEHVAPEVWRTSIQEVKKILQFGDINVSEVIIPADSYNEFDVVTREGWRILYSYQSNVRKQSNSLLVYLKEKLSSADRKTLDYFDLRIEDRIYYKQK